jgi:hypothetical protein
MHGWLPILSAAACSRASVFGYCAMVGWLVRPAPDGYRPNAAEPPFPWPWQPNHNQIHTWIH